MADLRKHSSTSNIVRFTLKSTATGQGITGLAYNTAGLIIGTIADNESATTRYRASSSEIEDISTLGTFAAPTGGKCRFKEVDATNHRGLYELQIADARFAVANAKRLVISVTGAINLLDQDYEIQLVRFDPYDGAGLGLSLIDAAISSVAASLASVDPTAYATATTLAGQINRIHALAGGTKATKDHSAATPATIHRNVADSAALVTRTRTVVGDTETITPS